MGPLDVAVRFGLYLDLAVTFGVLFLALLVPGIRGALPLGRMVLATAIAGLVLSMCGLMALAASMTGEPISEIDYGTLAMILAMPVGMAWIVRMVSLAAVVLAAAALRRQPVAFLAIASAGGAVALSTLAWNGHGAMDEAMTGWVHLGADIAHLIAAGAWAGAIAGLLALVLRPADAFDAPALRATHRALHGFGTIGTIIVAVILVTGLINSWLLVGPANVAALFTTLYGQLLLAKLALFAAMLGFAAANRYRLTPALADRIETGDHRAALVGLRASLALEAGCVLLVLALVAWLGTLEPVASMR